MLLVLAFSACSHSDDPEEDGGKGKLPSGKTYVEFVFKQQMPETNFELGLYKLSGNDSKDWPYKTTHENIRLMLWPETKTEDCNGKETSPIPVTPGETVSVLAYSTDNTNTLFSEPNLTSTPSLTASSKASSEEADQNTLYADEICYVYSKSYKIPSGTNSYEKRKDEKLGNIYVHSDTLELVPLTKPYLVEIQDPTGQMTQVSNIVITGLADGIDLLSGKTTDQEVDTYFEKALPIQAVTTVADTGERNFLGHVAAVRFRIWGPMSGSDVMLSFKVTANTKDYKFKVSIMDQISNSPNGGIIAITIPSGTLQ